MLFTLFGPYGWVHDNGGRAPWAEGRVIEQRPASASESDTPAPGSDKAGHLVDTVIELAQQLVPGHRPPRSICLPGVAAATRGFLVSVLPLVTASRG